MQPLTSVSCERGFSGMKRVKTALRNRMSAERLGQHMRVIANDEGMEKFDWNAGINLWIRGRRFTK